MLLEASRTFLDGNSTYNLANIILAAVGVLLGVIALRIAIVELRKVRSAANAARDASQATSAEFNKLASVISLSRACNHSAQLQMLVREPNLKAAAQRAFDLREALANLRFQQSTATLIKPAEWQLLLVRVAKIHDTLEQQARKPEAGASMLDWCLVEVAAVHEQLSGLSGLSSNLKPMVNHAHS